MGFSAIVECADEYRSQKRKITQTKNSQIKTNGTTANFPEITLKTKYWENPANNANASLNANVVSNPPSKA